MPNALIDNFANFSQWTVASGLSATANEVGATTGGATGAARKTYGVNGDELTLHFKLKPNKSDTAGRWIFVGQDNGSGSGAGVFYVQGVGICVGLIIAGAPDAGYRTVILDDAAITSGADYYVSVYYDGQSSDLKTIASVFDKAGNWLGGGEYGATVPAWYAMTNLYLAGNSSSSTIARLAADPNPVGSALTAPNRVVDLFGRWNIGNNANHWLDWYIPGHGVGANVLAVFCHPAGTWKPNTLMGSQDTLWNRALQPQENMAAGFLRAGCVVVMPACYSETGATPQSWASPDGYADAIAGINFAVAKMTAANGSAPKIILIAPSMGATLAMRLIIGGLANVRAVVLKDAVTSIVQANLDGTFGPQVAAAWGAAVSTIANYDAHALLETNPSLFRGIEWTIFNSTADVVVNPALYSDVFAGRLAAVDIPFVKVQRTYPAHYSPGAVLIPPSDVGLAVRRSMQAVTGSVSLAAFDTAVAAMVDAAAAVGSVVSAETLTRDLEPPAPAFTFRASRRADGTFTTDRPLRLRPGTVENVRIGIDTSLIGPGIITSVAAPEIDGGSLTVDGENVFDTMATLVVSGEATAGETRYIDIETVKRQVGTLQLRQEIIVGSA